MSDKWEANEDATLEDLLKVVDNLKALEDEDRNLGRNAVMKVHLLFSFLWRWTHMVICTDIQILLLDL